MVSLLFDQHQTNASDILIWEDRKFADIGMVMARQVKNHISRWADIVSVHSIAGLESVKTLDFISIFLY